MKHKSFLENTLVRESGSSVLDYCPPCAFTLLWEKRVTGGMWLYAIGVWVCMVIYWRSTDICWRSKVITEAIDMSDLYWQICSCPRSAYRGSDMVFFSVFLVLACYNSIWNIKSHPHLAFIWGLFRTAAGVLFSFIMKHNPFTFYFITVLTNYFPIFVRILIWPVPGAEQQPF